MSLSVLLLIVGRLSQMREDGRQEVSAYDLSNDHKPGILAEANRILAAGVSVVWPYAHRHTLILSRPLDMIKSQC